MDDFDGTVITEESVAGFFAGDDSFDTAEFDRKVKEAAYIEEVGEIEKLTEALRLGRLKTTDLSPEARKKGLAILKARRELVDSMYDGPLPKIEPKSSWSPARLAAQKAGLSKYEPGRPCVRGHGSLRYVRNNICTTCMSERGVIKRAKKEARLAEAHA